MTKNQTIQRKKIKETTTSHGSREFKRKTRKTQKKATALEERNLSWTMSTQTVEVPMQI
jgi:hypothetical protein